MTAAKLLATCVGIGYIQKGAGTVAALFCCLFWWALRVDQFSLVAQLLLLLAFLLLGIWSANRVEGLWGHDSNRVVIDEWFGMGVALVAVPFTWMNFLLAFGLFRFFDIAKPLFIRRLERLPGGWGVMADDLLAGIYSGLLLHLILKSNPL